MHSYLFTLPSKGLMRPGYSSPKETWWTLCETLKKGASEGMNCLQGGGVVVMGLEKKAVSSTHPPTHPPNNPAPPYWLLSPPRLPPHPPPPHKARTRQGGQGRAGQKRTTPTYLVDVPAVLDDGVPKGDVEVPGHLSLRVFIRFCCCVCVGGGGFVTYFCLFSGEGGLGVTC